MTDQEKSDIIGKLPNKSVDSKFTPKILTRLVWILWIVSTAMFIGVLSGRTLEIQGIASITGFTVLMWVFVTFISGIVHSYSKRYMAGSKNITRFYRLIFGFTLTVMILVAIEHIALLALTWTFMGLIISELIGYAKNWQHARKAANLSRKYFLFSSILLTVGVTILWLETGYSTVSRIIENTENISKIVSIISVTTILLAAIIQSALIPFHSWLLSSMTAPTPASALMHAGFVNAGGILLTLFGPLFVQNINYMLLIVIIGSFSALLGKLLKSVQSDIKGKLGCSTVAQMGFMIMQAGLGFFSAAIAHLILHAFYKGYLFLSSTGKIEKRAVKESEDKSIGIFKIIFTGVVAIVGGAVFAFLTGKGTSADSGILLTLLVVLTTLHATRNIVGKFDFSVVLGVIMFLFMPAIAVYSGLFIGISKLMEEMPVVISTTEITPVHVVLAVLFTVVYIAIEFELYQHSKWLYVKLLNLSQPFSKTVLTKKEEYNEY